MRPQSSMIRVQKSSHSTEFSPKFLPLRGYTEIGVGKRVDLLDSSRTSYPQGSVLSWFIEYSLERAILPI